MAELTLEVNNRADPNRNSGPSVDPTTDPTRDQRALALEKNVIDPKEPELKRGALLDVVTGHATAVDQLQARNEAIENSVIFRPDANLQPTVIVPRAGTSNHHDIANQQNQSQADLATSTKKKRVGSIDPAVEFVVQQLQSIVPPAVLDEIVHELEKSTSQRTGSEISATELTSIAMKLSNSLEGTRAPLELRNGEVSKSDAVYGLIKSLLGDSPEAEHKAQQVADYFDQRDDPETGPALRLAEFEMQARILGEARAGSADAVESKLASKQASEQLEVMLAEAAQRFGKNSPIIDGLRNVADLAEEQKRIQIVSGQIYTLAVDLKVHEGRKGQEAIQRKLEQTIADQQDLLTKYPKLAEALEQHRQAGINEGEKIRLRCEAAVQDIRADTKNAAKALEGMSQFELRLVRDRYQESYQEHLLDKIKGDLSGVALEKAMASYRGDHRKMGNDPQFIAEAQLSQFLPKHNPSLTTLLSNDPMKRVVTQINNVLSNSTAPALEIIAIVQTAQRNGMTLTDIRAALLRQGGKDIVEVLNERSVALAASQKQSVAAAKEASGVKIVSQLFNDGAISDRQIAEYAQILAIELGQAKGTLQGKESVDKKALESLDKGYERTQSLLRGFYASYPGAQQEIVELVTQSQNTARVATIAQLAGQYAEKVGIELGKREGGDPAKAQARLDAYLATHKEISSNNTEAAQKIAEAVASGKERGSSLMADVDKSVQQYADATGWWFGAFTDEEKLHQSIAGKSPQWMELFRETLQKQEGLTAEQLAEHDLSGAELDKTYGQLSNDRNAVVTADVEIALSGFWGPDHDGLQKSLRSLTNADERAAFVNRFDKKYAANHYSTDQDGNVTARATNTAEAFSLEMAGNKLMTANALLAGNEELAEASIAKGLINDPVALAKHLETITNPDGSPDLEKLREIDAEYSANFGRSLKTYLNEQVSDSSIDSNSAYRWAAAVLDGNRIDAGVHKLRYAMGGSADGTDETLIRDAFTLPVETQRRLAIAEHNGNQVEVSRIERQERTAREAIEARYNELFKDRKLSDDLASELNSHNVAVVTSLRQNGKLSLAEMVQDAVTGLGTDSELLQRVLAGKTKAEIAELRADFKERGFGDLDDAVLGDVSGDLEFDAKEWLQGTPENATEMIAAAERRLKHEQSGMLSGFASGRTQKRMEDDLKALKEAHVSGDSAKISAEFKKFCGSSDEFRAQRNWVADTVANGTATVVMIGGATAIVVFSGGVGTPVAFMLLAAGSGVIRMGTKYAIKGDGYGGEEILLDTGVTAIDVASAGVLSKIPVLGAFGQRYASKITTAAGERMAARGMVAFGRQGEELVGTAAWNAIGERSRLVRMTAQSVQGAVDGAVFAPIQGGAITALDGNTWQDGFASGLYNVAKGGIAQIPMGLVMGGLSSGLIGSKTPKHIALGRAAKPGQLADIPSMSAESQSFLSACEQSKGFISRGDIKDAKLMNKTIGESASKKLVDGIKAERPAHLTEADIKYFEAKAAAGGGLTRYDVNVIANRDPNYNIPVMSIRELEERLAALRARGLLQQLQPAAIAMAAQTVQVGARTESTSTESSSQISEPAKPILEQVSEIVGKVRDGSIGESIIKEAEIKIAEIDDKAARLEKFIQYQEGLVKNVGTDGMVDLGQGAKAPVESVVNGIQEQRAQHTELIAERTRIADRAQNEARIAEVQARDRQATADRAAKVRADAEQAQLRAQELSQKRMADNRELMERMRGPDAETSAERVREQAQSLAERQKAIYDNMVRENGELIAASRGRNAERSAEVRAEAAAFEGRVRDINQRQMANNRELAQKMRDPDGDLQKAKVRADAQRLNEAQSEIAARGPQKPEVKRVVQSDEPDLDFGGDSFDPYVPYSPINDNGPGGGLLPRSGSRGNGGGVAVLERPTLTDRQVVDNASTRRSPVRQSDDLAIAARSSDGSTGGNRHRSVELADPAVSNTALEKVLADVDMNGGALREIDEVIATQGQISEPQIRQIAKKYGADQLERVDDILGAEKPLVADRAEQQSYDFDDYVEPSGGSSYSAPQRLEPKRTPDSAPMRRQQVQVLERPDNNLRNQLLEQMFTETAPTAIAPRTVPVQDPVPHIVAAPKVQIEPRMATKAKVLPANREATALAVRAQPAPMPEPESVREPLAIRTATVTKPLNKPRPKDNSDDFTNDSSWQRLEEIMDLDGEEGSYKKPAPDGKRLGMRKGRRDWVYAREIVGKDKDDTPFDIQNPVEDDREG